MTDIREIRPDEPPPDDGAYDTTDVRGLPCQQCGTPIRYPVTYQGLGCFCSHTCAMAAAPRVATQLVRYLALLKARPQGCTDWEAKELLQVERTTINARRAVLERAGLVYADGFRAGPTGTKNTVYKAR